MSGRGVYTLGRAVGQALIVARDAGEVSEEQFQRASFIFGMAVGTLESYLEDGDRSKAYEALILFGSFERELYADE